MDIKKRLGWKPDRADKRDHVYRFMAEKPPAFMPEVDLRKNAPPAMDQSDIGSCVAHGVISGLRWHVRRSGAPDHKLSRLMLYYVGREIEKTVDEDSGLEIRDGIKAAQKTGVCHEDIWPYDISKFKVRPPKKAYETGNMWGNLTYEKVRVSPAWIKAALSEGFPVVMGTMLYESFENVKQDGIVRMPDLNNEEMLGGHCMIYYGYKMINGVTHFITRNSWGTSWGDKGDCYISEKYGGSERYGSSDFWIIKNLTGGW